MMNHSKLSTSRTSVCMYFETTVINNSLKRFLTYLVNASWYIILIPFSFIKLKNNQEVF